MPWASAQAAARVISSLTALSGRRQIVLVAGEAGIGKTTLVDVAVADLTQGSDPPPAVVRGQCVEQYGGGEPFLPVVEALAELCRGEHARRMQLVNEAWGILGDPSLRARYDAGLGLGGGPLPMQERPRPNRGPAVPAGKGWTPRRGDDRWQRDYRGWADEADELPPDLPGPGRRRGPLVVLPVALFAASVVALFVGVATTTRPLLAFGLAGIVVSAVLFVVLPMVEMARAGRRG